MRGRGITSGRRPVRPDGTYYRESRRRRVARAGRGRRSRLWVAMIAGIFLVVVTVWMLR